VVLVWPSPAPDSNCVATNRHHSRAGGYLGSRPRCTHRLGRQQAGARDRHCESVLCGAATSPQCATVFVRSSLADAHPSCRRQQGRLLLLSAGQHLWSPPGQTSVGPQCCHPTVFSARRSEHITPLPHDLHWLQVLERIRFRLCVLTHRCLNATAPPYFADGIRRAADFDGRHHLRSTALVVSPVRRSTLGDRAFPVAAPPACNSLPSPVLATPSLLSFRRELKTFLLKPY